MEQWILMAVVGAAVLGLFVLGMSLTLIFKGHHIRSEIGTNPEMKKRGIKCAADEMREADGCAIGSGCPAGSCESCGQADDECIK